MDFSVYTSPPAPSPKERGRGEFIIISAIFHQGTLPSLMERGRG